MSQNPSEYTPAEKAGWETGQAAGSWVFDGNSTADEARAMLNGIEEGDPQIMDLCPNPLSGEWAGESIPEMSAQFDIDLADDDTAAEFEAAFQGGYWNTVERAARALAGEATS